MSKSLNKVILIGNIGADPEVRSTSTGNRVATLSLATGRQWKGADGSKQEKTAWHKVTFWNSKNGQQLADLVERYCKKGDRIYVEGEIEYSTWQRQGRPEALLDRDQLPRDDFAIRQGWRWWRRGCLVERCERATAKSAAGSEAGQEVRLVRPDMPDALDADDDDLPF